MPDPSADSGPDVEAESVAVERRLEEEHEQALQQQQQQPADRRRPQGDDG
jgi:hypothetical protein